MNKQSDEKELHEILEKQRGTFCQISLFYFIAITAGLGLITSQQTILGTSTIAVDIIFLIAATVMFLFIAFKMSKPVEDIVALMESILKDYIEKGSPEEVKPNAV